MPNSCLLRAYERALLQKGCRYVAGVDEAGRGPLAGPVFAAAVILPEDHAIEGITDSKNLAPRKREVLSEQIKSKALSYCVAFVSHEEIDSINILRASLKAMALAVDGLKVKPDHVLVDGNMKAPLSLPQTAIVRGDCLSESIAAASILAKVARDLHMCKMEELYPQFSFAKHKGYGTARHLDELKICGPTPIHRRSFLKGL